MKTKLNDKRKVKKKLLTGKITKQTRYKNCFVEGAATEWRHQQIRTFPILTIRESLHT